MKISALVPVKNLDTAKSRLADVLSRNERRMLADLMLSDVVEVILKNPKIEKVFLVGDKQLSPKSGTFIIHEKFNNGYNEAISFALRDKLSSLTLHMNHKWQSNFPIKEKTLSPDQS